MYFVIVETLRSKSPGFKIRKYTKVDYCTKTFSPGLKFCSNLLREESIYGDEPFESDGDGVGTRPLLPHPVV